MALVKGLLCFIQGVLTTAHMPVICPSLQSLWARARAGKAVLREAVSTLGASRITSILASYSTKAILSSYTSNGIGNYAGLSMSPPSTSAAKAMATGQAQR